MITSPQAEAHNHKVALEAARAHFGGRKPSFAEAHKYGDQLAFEAEQESVVKHNLSLAAARENAAEVRYYARAAALALHHT